MKERYELTIERIRAILKEETADTIYREYFYKVSEFILEVYKIWCRIQKKSNELCTLEELQAEQRIICRDIREDVYEVSYANPTYAVKKLGEEIGKILCVLYAEIRSEGIHVYEDKLEYLTICNELFIEIYNCFENASVPEYKELKSILYWYASDYCDVYVAEFVEEHGLCASTEYQAVNLVTREFGFAPKNQYLFDHYMDEGIFLDKKYLERKLDVIRSTYERTRKARKTNAELIQSVDLQKGTCEWIEKPERVVFHEKQLQWRKMFHEKLGQIEGVTIC